MGHSVRRPRVWEWFVERAGEVLNVWAGHGFGIGASLKAVQGNLPESVPNSLNWNNNQSRL